MRENKRSIVTRFGRNTIQKLIFSRSTPISRGGFKFQMQLLHTRFQAFLFLSFLQISSISAAVIYVRHDASGPAWDGTSWQTAFRHIKDAMEAAQYGDEIWVKKGNYQADLINAQMKNGVKLYGGFTGSETALTQRDWLQNETIISRSDTPGDNYTYKFLLCKGTDSTTTLDGITFLKGVTFWTDSDDVCWPNEDISYCTGGAIFVYSPHPDTLGCLRVLNCTFRGNAGRFGSAIGMNLTDGSGGVYVDNCRFEDGHAGDGGIFIFTGSEPQWKFEVKNTSFVHNKATGWGAPAISFVSYRHDAFLCVENALFEDNFCEGLPGSGAVGHFKAIGRYGEFTNCIFRDNNAGTSQFVPGRGALSGIRMKVTSCLFADNKAFIGGALSCSQSKITDCVFIGNYASDKAGIVNSSGDTYMLNCTFYDNYAEKQSLFSNILTGDYYYNNVFSNNRTGDGSPLFRIVDTITVAHCAFNAIDSSSLFSLTGALYYSPSNLLGIDPMFRDTAAGDLSLLPCSPLIDKGDSSYLSGLDIDKDYAGNPRLLGSNVDIGAYEAAPLNFTWTTDSVTGGWTITLNVPPSYDVQWSANVGGQAGPVVIGLAAGNYSATVTDPSGCSTVVGPMTVGVSMAPEVAALAGVQVSPNPFRQQLRVSLAVRAGGQAEFLLLNVLGRQVASGPLRGDDTVLDLPPLPLGLYVWQVRWPGGAVQVGKLVRVE